MTLNDAKNNYNENGSAMMTEKRFTYEYDEYSGNLFDNQMNTFYPIEDSDENIKLLCDKLNWLVEENEQLKQRNENQYKQLNKLWELIQAKDWETLTAMDNQMKEDEERLHTFRVAEESYFIVDGDEVQIAPYSRQFASKTLLEAIKPMKTVGVLKENPQEKLWEIGVPIGLIAGIVPSTNPTSTVIYKAMISMKAERKIAVLC